MHNAVFGKTMENVRKHRDIKLVITKAKKDYLASEPNYHKTKLFSENLLVIVLKRTQILKNTLVYLCLSIFQISKIVLSVFWYDYVKPKYGEKSQLCYLDQGSFILHIKTKYICVDIARCWNKIWYFKLQIRQTIA